MFLDESGDPGFKLDKGSTPFFCMAAIIVWEFGREGETC